MRLERNVFWYLFIFSSSYLLFSLNLPVPPLKWINEFIERIDCIEYLYYIITTQSPGMISIS